MITFARSKLLLLVLVAAQHLVIDYATTQSLSTTTNIPLATATSAATTITTPAVGSVVNKNSTNIRVQYLTPITQPIQSRDERTPKSPPPLPATTTATSITTATSQSAIASLNQQQQTNMNVVTSTSAATAATTTTTANQSPISTSQQPPTTTVASATTTATSTAPITTAAATTKTTTTTTSQQKSLVCLFRDRSYEIGDKWFDDCVSKCQCVLSDDNNRAIIACEDRCPKYIDIIPSNCEFQRSQEDVCCLVKVCNENTSTSMQQQSNTKSSLESGNDSNNNSPTTAGLVDVNTRIPMQQTADDYSQTPITVTDIKLIPPKTTAGPAVTTIATPTTNPSHQSGRSGKFVVENNSYNNNDIQFPTNAPTTITNRQYTQFTQTLRPVTSPPTTATPKVDNTVPTTDKATTISATSTTTTTTATNSNYVVPTVDQPQDSMLPSENNVAESNIFVDPHKEDLCIIDERTVYRINQLVELPDCDKKCRCQYSPSTDSDTFSNCTSAQDTVNLYSPNGAPPRRTEIACDTKCDPILSLQLTPSKLCNNPRCNVHNICECPYLTCDTLPLHEHPAGIPVSDYPVSRNNKTTLAPHTTANSNKCSIRGRELAINETFNDECHSICTCTDKLEVQCGAVTCPSRLPPASSDCANWAYDVDFRPSAPDCCPPLICKDANDGSCYMVGVTIKHGQPLPEEINGCAQRCVCLFGKIVCEPTCPASSEQPPEDLECPNGAMPVQEPTKDCQCPKWVCPPYEDISLKDVTVEALNSSAVRVRFTLPREAINQHGWAELNYTMDPDGTWAMQRIARPGKLFDTYKIEYLLNKFIPEHIYFFKVRVLFDQSNDSLIRGPLESSIIKVSMPASVLPNPFEQPKPSPSTRIPTRITTPRQVETTTSSTTTTTTTTSTTTTPSPPKEVTFDFNLTARALGPEVVLVQWRSLTPEERQYVDSFQIKYRRVTSSGDDATNDKLSQLLHKETDQTLIYYLQPNMSYSLDLIVNQPSGAPVILRSYDASTFVTTQQKQELALLEMKRRELELEARERTLRKQHAESLLSTQAPITDSSAMLTPNQPMLPLSESPLSLNFPANRLYAWYSLLFLTGLMTLSFTIVLYLLLKKSSSAIAPISSQSAYDNPSFTKLVSYYEPAPYGVDPNNNNLDSSMKPLATPIDQINSNNKLANGNNLVNGNNNINMNNNNSNMKNFNNMNNNNKNIKNLNNNNSHPYNEGWDNQRPEHRLI